MVVAFWNSFFLEFIGVLLDLFLHDFIIEFFYFEFIGVLLDLFRNDFLF